MRNQRLMNLLAILVGGVGVAIGVLLLAIVASGNVIQGKAGLALSGAALLLLVAAFLAVPFSVRVAKWLTLLALACLASLAIRLVFWPQPGVAPTLLVQIAVIAFAALLVIRVFLRRRRNGAEPGR
ncbi:hypothetical protein [Stenotrophomonas rhizophila]|uniref:hypothetical protein n=1 Tax=Stenotrophomonas rhizophila TaxID=216778 RepID=UPI000456C759|nr:hypothetical protein [Stenotrophomonas rhizophila]AHY58443.1 hypothetical protein DX03_07055 [Stenotrophomonas rhizophila]